MPKPASNEGGGAHGNKLPKKINLINLFFLLGSVLHIIAQTDKFTTKNPQFNKGNFPASVNPAI